LSCLVLNFEPLGLGFSSNARLAKNQGRASRREEERWFTFLRARAASGDSSAAGGAGSADGAARSSTGGATFKLKATLILEGNTLYTNTCTYLHIVTGVVRLYLKTLSQALRYFL
jgi:hypothetical protein